MLKMSHPHHQTVNAVKTCFVRSNMCSLQAHCFVKNVVLIFGTLYQFFLHNIARKTY
jgi:hypothetical protein